MADEASAGTRLLLRLYSPVRRRPPPRPANCARCSSAGTRDYRLEVVDCIREPQRALQDGVLVTPTLLKLEPNPKETIIGTLSDARKVALTLGLVDGRDDESGRRGEGGGRGTNPHQSS